MGEITSSSSFPRHLTPLTSLPHLLESFINFVIFLPHRFNRYFALPVDQAMLSNYSVYVRNPIDLSTIRARLGEEPYTYLLFFPISHSPTSVYLSSFHPSHSSHSIFMKHLYNVTGRGEHLRTQQRSVRCSRTDRNIELPCCR